MIVGDLCPDLTLYRRDPRFNGFKEHYADRHWNDEHLVQALELFKRRHNDKYEDDWIPATPSEMGVFTRFLNYELKRAQLAQTTATADRFP